MCPTYEFSLRSNMPAMSSKQRLREFHYALHKVIHLFFCGFSVFVMVTQVSEIAEMLVESPLRDIDHLCLFSLSLKFAMVGAFL